MTYRGLISMAGSLPPRGTGIGLGTARRGLGRGAGAPLTEEQRRARHGAIFGQGIVRNILSSYVDWFIARPKIRELILPSGSSQAQRPTIF